IIEFLYRRLKVKEYENAKKSYTLNRIVIYLFVIVLFVITARGGLQLKPIAIISAVQFTAPGHAPVILNTPFTIIKTITKDDLKDVNYFADKSEIKNYFNTTRNYSGEEFKRLNIIVIILESFSAEYSHLLSGNEGYTPF